MKCACVQNNWNGAVQASYEYAIQKDEDLEKKIEEMQNRVWKLEYVEKEFEKVRLQLAGKEEAYEKLMKELEEKEESWESIRELARNRKVFKALKMLRE